MDCWIFLYRSQRWSHVLSLWNTSCCVYGWLFEAALCDQTREERQELVRCRACKGVRGFAGPATKPTRTLNNIFVHPEMQLSRQLMSYLTKSLEKNKEFIMDCLVDSAALKCLEKREGFDNVPLNRHTVMRELWTFSCRTKRSTLTIFPWFWMRVAKYVTLPSYTSSYMGSLQTTKSKRSWQPCSQWKRQQGGISSRR